MKSLFFPYRSGLGEDGGMCCRRLFGVFVQEIAETVNQGCVCRDISESSTDRGSRYCIQLALSLSCRRRSGAYELG